MRLIKLIQTGTGLDMFDLYTDTQTTASDELAHSFDVSGMNAVFAANTGGLTARLTVHDNDLDVDYYTEEVSLIRDSVKDMWDYVHAKVRNGRDIVWYFEARANATAAIRIEYAGGTAACGLCAPGITVEMGPTRYGVETGITDYSIYDEDEFGRTYLSVGDWAKRASADIQVLNAAFDATHNKVISVRGLPAVYDLNNYAEKIEDGHTSLNGYQRFLVYGWWNDFRPRMDKRVMNKWSFDIQGVR